MGNRKYVVTAVSRLSGERERISGPVSEDLAIRLKLDLKRKRACYRPYIRIRVMPFPYKEEWLPFPRGGGKTAMTAYF